MESPDTHALGYQEVDEDQNIPVLVGTMDATAAWSATIRLRSWERRHLRPPAGGRLLDVGCGLGDAALAFADDVGPGGAIVGVDLSTSMLDVARQRAQAAPCSVRFSVGDAHALDEPDRSFDAARCERTLQWVRDPPAAVHELSRVLRPGAPLSLIDTDWSTLRIDVGHPELTGLVRDAMRVERARPSNVGSRLSDLVRAAGCDIVAETAATQRWTRWDPDTSPAPDGCFSMRSLAVDLVDAGALDRGDLDRFVSTIHDAARNGRFSMALTMFAVVATVPAQ